MQMSAAATWSVVLRVYTGSPSSMISGPPKERSPQSAQSVPSAPQLFQREPSPPSSQTPSLVKNAGHELSHSLIRE